MRTSRAVSNTAALSLSRPVPQRSADFVERCWASRSWAEFFSERSATVRAPAECVRSPLAVLKAMESEKYALKRITGGRQPAASAAERNWWEQHFRAMAATKRKQAKYRVHGPATGSGPSRVASHLAPAVSSEAEPASGCEPSLFSVGQVPPLALEKLTRNRRLVTT